MKKPRFFFLEPSKVGSQHITLIEGYLAALAASRVIAEKYELVLCVSKSTLASLPPALTAQFSCNPVPVMNPEKRRLVLKTFVELFVVLRYVVKLRQGDVLFVSCVLPTTLWLLEAVNRFLRRSGVHVVLHGEIEGLFDPAPQSFRAFGYWAQKWMRSRKRESRIFLVVLDDFIRDKLVQEYTEKLSSRSVSVVHHPVVPATLAALDYPQSNLSVCFIGYRSRFKGFDDFRRMASEHPSVSFLAIGGAKVENISTGTVEYLSANSDYLCEISKCSAALFPYTALYACSLSAAALDALAAGVRIVALDRPFFRSLAWYFGSEVVAVCSSLEEFGVELEDNKLLLNQERRVSRLERLSSSKYSLAAVQRSFEKLVFNPAS